MFNVCIFFSSHVLPKGYDTEDDENRLRSVVSVQDYDFGDEYQEERCGIADIAVLPSGDIILVDLSNRQLVKLNTNYKITSSVYVINHHSLCFIGNDTVVLGRLYQLTFVDVRDNMPVIESVSITDHDCLSLTYHSGKLYVLTYYTVHVYSTDGKYLRVLYTSEDEEKFDSFYDIVTNHDGTIIYIITVKSKLITIDNSGDHLFTLDLHKYDNIVRVEPIHKMCVDDRGFVILLCEDTDNKQILVQISPDGRRCYGTVFLFQSSNKYQAVQFDSHKKALVLAGLSEKIKVLTLR